MTAGPDDGDHRLVQLREQARQLVIEVGGPLRRLTMRSGDAALDLEWHPPVCGPGPGTADRPGSTPAVVPETVPPGATAAAPAHEPAPTTPRSCVVAPMVGTFYRAPEPGAAPFVEIGDLVEPGQVVGIVEAMKLMNHIVAEQAGEIAEVLVGDGEPVEFEQPLIALVSA